MNVTDLSHWEGDGLPEEVEEIDDYLGALGMLPNELDALYEGCKSQGWIAEQMAKSVQGQEATKWRTLSGFFWRRAQRWKELAERMRVRADEREEG